MEMDEIGAFFNFLRRERRYVLSEAEAKEILKLADIPITRELVAKNAEEAQEIAEIIGYPVVMKIVSPDILHKTDSGAIRIGLKSNVSVKEAYYEIEEKAKQFNPSAHIQGVLIQEMLFSGIETILGVTVDDQFGPTLMFGLGGVFSEVLQDVTFRIIPVDKENAFAMIQEIKSRRIFEGYRGFPPLDKSKLADVMVKLSEFSYKFRNDIQEIDINPLYCQFEEIKAMDALIVLKG